MAAVEGVKKRLDSIDIVRGIVMVIMALDHSRDFMSKVQYDPTDLSKVSTGLFLTRFITHYCAATFVFLAGTSAFLSISRGKTKNQAALFLFKRALWLIFLELTIIRYGWILDFNYHFIFLQVIWAIGCSMLVLSVLVYLPAQVVAAIGLVMIFGHDTLDKYSPHFNHTGTLIWDFLHVQGIVNIDGVNIFILYPLVPWIGVMATGYGFGMIFKKDSAERKKILTLIGCGAILLFLIIRSFNFYGDPANWVNEGVWYRDILSFINVSKYPPSLDYLLITLGPIMLVLAAFENVKNRVTDIFLVYGRVPLFYYTLHIYLLQFLAYLAFCIIKPGPNYIAPLPYVYILWVLGVSILYFPCRWFMRYRATHKQWWLSYL